MVDYYSALMRAVTAPDAGDVQWRRGMYDRARQLLAARLRERRPPARQAEITAELSALDAAIARIEAEMSWADQGGEIADVGAIEAGARTYCQAVAIARLDLARARRCRGRARRRRLGILAA